MSSEWWTKAWLRMKALVNRGRLERDLEEEMQFHLEMLAEKMTLPLVLQEKKRGRRRGGDSETSHG